jgi:hypothetical protein
MFGLDKLVKRWRSTGPSSGLSVFARKNSKPMSKSEQEKSSSDTRELLPTKPSDVSLGLAE